jgi:peptidoglycan hydrolase FlgJ
MTDAILPLSATPPPQAGRHDAALNDAALHKAAEQLEASFLAEMLKFAGAEKVPQDFGGGIGEQQFASFLGQAQAEAMVKHGGIGLADKLYTELKERADAKR